MEHLKGQNIALTRENLLGNGIGDAIIADPDGNKLYFDTTPEEERID